MKDWITQQISSIIEQQKQLEQQFQALNGARQAFEAVLARLQEEEHKTLNDDEEGVSSPEGAR